MSDELLDHLLIAKEKFASTELGLMRYICTIHREFALTQIFLRDAQNCVLQDCKNLVKMYSDTVYFARMYADNESHGLEVITKEMCDIESYILSTYNACAKNATLLAKKAVGVLYGLIHEVSQLQKNVGACLSQTTTNADIAAFDICYRDAINDIIQEGNVWFTETLEDIKQCRHIMLPVMLQYAEDQ